MVDEVENRRRHRSDALAEVDVRKAETNGVGGRKSKSSDGRRENGFKRMRVQHKFAMFGDVQIRIWGATMVDRRRMYFEAALRPGVYDVIVNFNTTIRMTAGEVGGYITGNRLGSQERKDAATDEYEAHVLVTSASPVLGIVIL